MNEMEAAPNEWSRRILALERQNRRLHGLVVLLVLMALVQTAWHLLPGAPVISAERFVVKRRGGPPRGEFSLWQDGTPAFRINNEKGEARALWALRRDGTLSLRMNDVHHMTRVEMLVDPDGLPRVALYGSDGRSRANLYVNDANQADLMYPVR